MGTTRALFITLLITLLTATGCGVEMDGEGPVGLDSSGKGDSPVQVQVVPASRSTLEQIGVAMWTFGAVGEVRVIIGRAANGDRALEMDLHPGRQRALLQLWQADAESGRCLVDDAGATRGEPEACVLLGRAQQLFTADLEAATGQGQPSTDPRCESWESSKNHLANASYYLSGGVALACSSCALSIASMYYGWWGPSWSPVYLTCGACASALGITIPAMQVLQACR